MTLPPTWTMFGADHVPHRLLLLAKMLDRESAKQLQTGFGLSLAEWRVLAFICSVGPASAAEVGTAFETDRAEVSRAVVKLVECGLIARKADATNRKRQILHPTDEGRRIFEAARQQRQAYFLDVMQDVDREERALFDAVLQKLALRVTNLREG